MAVQSGSVAEEGSMSVDDAVKFTHLSRTEIYRAMKSGQVVFTKIGKRRLIMRRSLVAFLERGIPQQLMEPAAA